MTIWQCKEIVFFIIYKIWALPHILQKKLNTICKDCRVRLLMRVQYRLLILSSLLGIIFLAGFFILQQTQIANSALLIEGQRSKLDKLFNQLVKIEGQSMEVLVYDYTFWDELVDFVNTANPDFATNVLDESLEGYDVDAIWIFDPDFQPVYFTCRSCRQEDYSFPLTNATLSAAFNGTPFAHFYYKNVDDEVIEIRAATIHPSDDVSHQTPGRGYMFVGRIWKGQRLISLSQLTDSQIEIVEAASFPASTISNPMDDIFIYHPLSGFDGQTVAYLEGRFSNQYASGFNQAKQRDLIYYAGIRRGFIGRAGDRSNPLGESAGQQSFQKPDRRVYGSASKTTYRTQRVRTYRPHGPVFLRPARVDGGGHSASREN